MRVHVASGIALLMLCSQTMLGQESEHPVRDGLRGSFQLPLHDLLVKKHESEWRNLLNGLQVHLAYNQPLRNQRFDPRTGFSSQGALQTSTPTGQFGFVYTPISYWFFRGDALAYADLSKRAPWNPSFTYVFGYDDWHPYTFSLTYSNYNGNRFFPSPSKGEGFAHPTQGGITAGYKFPAPERLQHWMTITKEGRINLRADYTATPEYFDLRTAKLQSWRQSASLNIRYDNIWRRFYAEIRPYVYPQGHKQQPWDPDYTYSFGWFDYRPGHLSIIYSNYSGNRYNGRHLPTTGTFLDGSIALGWTYAWE